MAHRTSLDTHVPGSELEHPRCVSHHRSGGVTSGDVPTASYAVDRGLSAGPEDRWITAFWKWVREEQPFGGFVSGGGGEPAQYGGTIDWTIPATSVKTGAEDYILSCCTYGNCASPES